jgi:hypothetical protein
MTIAAWIKPDFTSSNAIDTILEKRDPGTGSESYSFIFAALKAYSGYPPGVFGLGMLPQIPFIYSTNRIPDDGHFHHVAVTYNGNKASGNCVLYLDGQVAGGGDGPGPIPVTASGPYMGVQRFMPPGYDHNCAMGIDEIGFFGRELSAAEIAYLYSGPNPPVTQGLKLHLDASNANGDGSNPADGASVSTWHDVGGLGLDATPLFGVAPVYRTNALNGRGGVDFSVSGSDALATAFTSQFNFTNCTIFMVGNGAGMTCHVSISAPCVNQEFAIGDKAIYHHSSGYHWVNRDHQDSPAGYYIQAGIFGATTNELANCIDGVFATNRLFYSWEIGQQFPVAGYAPVARQVILGWRNSDAYCNAPISYENFGGVICEALVYDHQLDAGQLDAVNAYLAGKYNLVITPLPPVLQVVSVGGGTVMLAWESTSGRQYQLQSCTDLGAASWTNEGARLAGTGGVLTANAILDSETAKFFRLQLIGY